MITGTSLENLWGILAWPKASSLFTLASNESDTGLSPKVDMEERANLSQGALSLVRALEDDEEVLDEA